MNLGHNWGANVTQVEVFIYLFLSPELQIEVLNDKNRST